MANSSFDQQYFALLASRVREGDPDAFAELYAATHDTLYRSVWYVLRNPEDAQDVMQEIYISVYKNIGSLKIDRLLLPWMRQIAYHSCCDFLRETRAPQDMFVELNDTTAPPRLSDDNPFSQVNDRDTWNRVKAALDRRPARERQAFLLRYETGLKLEEVADFMGTSLATVKRYINAARAALQEDLAGLKS